MTKAGGKKSGLQRSLLIGAAVAAMTAGAAEAQTAPAARIDISAQNLAGALNRVGRQTGTEIIFAPSAARGRRAAALQGDFTIEEALDRLLAGTGLRYRRTGQGAYVVEPVSGEAQAGGAAADSESAENQDIVVTGTNIRGARPTSPLTVITRDELDRGGVVTAQEALRRSPQNFAGTNSGTTRLVGGNAGYTTQADLRGLGPEATLTLVNGRRFVSSSGDRGRAVDLNVIPAAAIERVEILTDGASALYGSDAIGGVVNFILRQDFRGVDLSAYYGLNEGGADERVVSGVAGARWAGGSALVSAQYIETDAVAFREIGIASADLRSLGGGDYRVSIVGSPPNVLPVGFFSGQPFSTVTGPGGSPVFFASVSPSNTGPVTAGDLLLNTLNPGDILPAEAIPSTETLSFYGTVRQAIGPWELFADGIYSERRTEVLASPYVNLLVTPPSNPFSTFAEPVLVGVLDLELLKDSGGVRSREWAANVGVRGEIGTNWQAQIVASASRGRTRERIGLIDEAELSARLFSSDPATAYNPFAPASQQAPGVVDALQSELDRSASSRLHAVSALVNGTLFERAAGAVRLSIGSEFRSERLDAPSVASVSRDAGALFAEIYLPLFGDGNARPGLTELALSGAGRYDNYSDFGSTFNPKLGVLWRPFSDLTFTANYGTSFRAPLLSQLYFTRTPPRPQLVFDLNAPNGPRQVLAEVVTGGNPDLTEETATTISAGGSYRPRWISGLDLRAYFFLIDYDNRIRGNLDGLTTGDLLQIEDRLPPGIIVRDAAGNLVRLNLVDVNSALTRVEGVDLAASYAAHAAGIGDLRAQLSGTIYTRFRDQLVAGAPVIELAGRLGSVAEWRGRLDVSWSSGPFGATVAVSHVDGLRNEDPDPRIVDRTVGGQTTIDAQFVARLRTAIGTGPNLTFRVGVKNLFNARSPFTDSPFSFGVDAQNYVIARRTVYFSLSHSFGR